MRYNEWVLTNSDEKKIRRGILPETGEQVFSVVDVIDQVTKSVDARNYWKVLKNRLKKEQNELVTRCNQLKLKARDGKLYLTDVADLETLTEIIKLVPGAHVNDLHACLAPFIDPVRSHAHAEGASPADPGAATSNGASLPEEAEEDSSRRSEAEAVLLIDMYEKNGALYIEAFVAGVGAENISIHATKSKITIFGKREDPKKNLGGEFLIEELAWLSFERTIEFPFPVHSDKIDSMERDGKLIIRIPKNL